MKKPAAALKPVAAMFVFSAAFIAAGLFSSSAYAGDAGGLQKKWAWANYYECIRSSGWLTSINTTNDTDSRVVQRLYSGIRSEVYLPSYQYGHSSGKTSLSCMESIGGTDGWTGALQEQNDIRLSNPGSAETLLKNLGYEPGSSSGAKSFAINASTRTKSDIYGLTTTIGEWSDWSESGSSSVLITVRPNDDGTTNYSYSDGIGNFLNDINIVLDGGEITIQVSSGRGNIQSVTVPLDSDPEKTRDSIEGKLRNQTWSKHSTSAVTDGMSGTEIITDTEYRFTVGSIVDMGDSGVYSYQYADDRYAGADKAAQSYGEGGLSSLVPTPTEKYNLYLYYLQKALPSNVENRLTVNPTDTANLTKVRLKHTDGTFKDFYANFNGTSPSSITVYSLEDYHLTSDTSRHFPKVVAITMEDVISWFNSVDVSTLGDVDPTGDEGDTDDGAGDSDSDAEDGGESEEEKCYQNAKSLGWVICPVVFGLREMTGNFYEAVEPLIRIDNSVVGQLGDSSSGLFQAWSAFRNIADVIFAVIFLVVIISQLTGYGIDNYGIKRTLPRLILTAILVNLSFILCAIAVDASNIIGSSIRELFESIANTATSTSGGADVLGGDSTNAAGIMVQKAVGFIAAAGTVTAIAGVAIALQGWAVVIPILIFLLTVAIAILFALIILGLRQALVVILVVASPLAFVCMVLPNTEGIFRKWWSAAKAMLTVYPVVGAVIGAGYLTASILMSTDQGFIMTVVSGILMVAPYFLIPSLTRKSLEVMGDAGNRIARLGDRARNGAGRGIGNTQAVKNARADSAAQRAQARAARYMRSNAARRVEEDMAAGRSVSIRRANRYTRAAGLANAGQNATVGARSAQSQYNRMQGTGFDAAMSAAAMTEDATTTKNWETMLSAGDYSYMTQALNDDGSLKFDEEGNAVMQENRVDYQNNEQIAAALEHELRQTGGRYDANKVRALSNVLASKGKEGRNLMYNVAAHAQDAGATDQAMKDFAGNIMNNHARTFKEKHRSLYEFAKANAGREIGPDGKAEGGMGRVTDYAASGVGSLTAADMTNMDLMQLQRYHRNASSNVNPNTGRSDAQVIAKLAQDALSDEHLSKDLSEKTRTELESIARDGGFTPPVRTGRLSEDSIKIDHGGAMDRDSAVQGARDITASQNAEMITEAIRNRRDVISRDDSVRQVEEDALRAIQNGAGSNASRDTTALKNKKTFHNKIV